MTAEIKEMIEALKNEGATGEQVRSVINEIDELTAEERAEVIGVFASPTTGIVPPPPAPPTIWTSPVSVPNFAQRLKFTRGRWLLLGVGIVVLVIVIYAFWPRNSRKIVGKWRLVGGSAIGKVEPIMEFFADGKMTCSEFGGQLVEYGVDDDKLTIGPKNKSGMSQFGLFGRPFSVSFPDSEHMDWTYNLGISQAVPGARSETKTIAQTIRFERVKSEQAVQ